MKADAAEPRLQIAHIAGDARADIGIDHRRRDALVLAIFAQDLVRERDEGSGQAGAHDLAGQALVLGVGVGMEKADRDRVDTLARERGVGLAHAVAVEALQHLAGGIEPLGDLDRAVARHQRARAVEEEIVGLGPVAAADDVDIARAARHEEADRGALALDQRVDGDGRAVDQRGDAGRRKVCFADAIDDAVHGIARRRGCLGVMDAAGRIVESDEIGKSTADIDCHEDQGPPRRKRRGMRVDYGELHRRRNGFISRREIRDRGGSPWACSTHGCARECGSWR